MRSSNTLGLLAASIIALVITFSPVHSAINSVNTLFGAGSGATLTPIVVTACDLTASVNVTAGNTTEVIPVTPGRVIHVCQYVLTISVAGTAQWKRGTGSNCGTGTATYNQPFFMATNGVISAGTGIGDLFYNLSGEAICLGAVTGNVAGMVLYAAR